MNYSDMSKGMLYRIQLIDEFVQTVAPDVERQWSDGESGPGLAEVKCRLRYNEHEVLVVITEDSVQMAGIGIIVRAMQIQRTLERLQFSSIVAEISRDQTAKIRSRPCGF